MSPAEGRELLRFALDYRRLDAPLGYSCLDLARETRHRRQDDLQRTAIPFGNQRQRFAKGLGEPVDFSPATPRENEEHRACRLREPNPFAGGRTKARQALDQRVADIAAGRTAQPGMHRRLEGQEREDMVDEAFDPARPPRTPYPHRGR